MFLLTSVCSQRKWVSASWCRGGVFVSGSGGRCLPLGLGSTPPGPPPMYTPPVNTPPGHTAPL